MPNPQAKAQRKISVVTSKVRPPLLIVAALKRELAVIARDRRGGLALLDTGEGPRNAERALRAWLNEHQAQAVINVGFGGALSASLQAGDLAIAREVRGPGRQLDASRSPLFQLASHLDGVRIGTAITVDEIVCKATAKRQLAEAFDPGETAWVDMESLAVAEVCDELQMPYLIVRAISDAVNEDLPVD